MRCGPGRSESWRGGRGLTVRTLHHYDEIGLLAPSWRTGAGHRQYTADDVARLQMIVSLRQLGLPSARSATGSPVPTPRRAPSSSSTSPACGNRSTSSRRSTAGWNRSQSGCARRRRSPPKTS